MAISYRVIYNLEQAIEDKEKHSSNLDKPVLWGEWGRFQVKLRLEASRVPEYIPEQAVLNELL